MRSWRSAGALLLGADGDVSDEEVKILVQILHHWFTDDPQDEIVTDRAEIERRLPEAVAIVNKEGDTDDKRFVLSRLADIALADGALMDAESAGHPQPGPVARCPRQGRLPDHGRRRTVGGLPDRREAEPHGRAHPPIHA